MEEPLEFATFADGRICVGRSNRDENGGFTVLGDVTDAVHAIWERCAGLAETEPELPGAMPSALRDWFTLTPEETAHGSALASPSDGLNMTQTEKRFAVELTIRKKMLIVVEDENVNWDETHEQVAEEFARDGEGAWPNNILEVDEDIDVDSITPVPIVSPQAVSEGVTK